MVAGLSKAFRRWSAPDERTATISSESDRRYHRAVRVGIRGIMAVMSDKHDEAMRLAAEMAAQFQKLADGLPLTSDHGAAEDRRGCHAAFTSNSSSIVAGGLSLSVSVDTPKK